METLTSNDLVQLLAKVFPRLPQDRRLGILVDVPCRRHEDHSAWRQRRRLAGQWARSLKRAKRALGLEGVDTIVYAAVGSNNADLPPEATICERIPATAAALPRSGPAVAFADIFAAHQLFLAPTEFSATAPLKNAARQFGFRAATMPGFTAAMIPALRLDYGEVGRRVARLKELLDHAAAAEVLFIVDGRQEHRIRFDLRFRQAHESSGRFSQAGTAGNLPSGEAYIVPYEGEKGEKSGTCGELPVQIEDEVVVFEVRENRAVAVAGSGAAARDERRHLEEEPAYGNMAELGFGVLGDFGLQPIGELLLDEKLGFHVAFGRSDHFGGRIGAADFSSPQAVIHLDRIYIPAAQPRVALERVQLIAEGGRAVDVMMAGKYSIF